MILVEAAAFVNSNIFGRGILKIVAFFNIQVIFSVRFEDVSKTLGRKLQALEIYAEDMRNWPHSRSLQAVEHLARWRGATVGVEAAEAFLVLREVC